tara:strand:+ start:1181 stop:1501 length:321 start_codon:yes stop_codon:yes gene_type:complete
MTIKRIEGFAWKYFQAEEEEEILYRIQLEQIDGRSLKKMKRDFEEDDWVISAEGWNSRNQTSILFVTKSFGSEGELKKWAKDLPYALNFITPRGKLRPLNKAAKEG